MSSAMTSDSIADESIAHSFSWTKTKRVLVSALALWVTLLCWSLASPLGATPDENFHIGSIWCAQGKNQSTCFGADSAGNALTPFIYDDCYSKNSTKSASCNEIGRPSSPKGGLFPFNFRGIYPNGYYQIMHQFVGSNPTLSILKMRIFNLTIATLLFTAITLVASKKQFTSWLTGVVFTTVPLGLSLIASINPSGWAITGIGSSWMFLAIGLTTKPEDRYRKYGAMLLWLFSGFLCIASRYDAAIYWIVTSIIITIIHSRFIFVKKDRNRTLHKKILIGASIIVVLFMLFSTKIPYGIRSQLEWRVPVSGEPRLSIWISSWFIHMISLPIEAFGTGGLGSHEIYMPNIVTIVGTALLGTVLLFSLIKTSVAQLATLLVSVLIMTIFAMHIANEEFDFFNASGRYILPLVPFTVGICIYLSHSPFQMMDFAPLRKWAILLMTITHALSLYTVVERYVMGTSYGVRILDVGEDTWWWPVFPIGPNFLILIGSLSFMKFMLSVWKQLPSIQIPQYQREQNNEG